MFTDKVILQLAAGKGGNGVVAWRREKYIPKGGPYGGNGGRGGSVTLQADTQIYSLEKYHYQKRFTAENGQQGGSNCQQGRTGKDLTLKVPCGTLIKDPETGVILHDLTEDGQKVILCQGGRGGRGNHSFRTPTRQAPNICTLGREGESLNVELELKLIADVGFVGFPNAGKSTLFSELAQVSVKIAPYPFTTLSPNLGFIQRQDYTRIYLADIPGIIEDAHQNRGLGLEFLRHIERTHVLLFVLDASGIDGRTPLDDWRVLQKEIGAYNPALLQKPYYIVLNKMDVQEASALAQEFMQEFVKDARVDASRVYQLSAKTSDGITPLLQTLVE